MKKTKKNDVVRASWHGNMIFKATLTFTEFYVVKWEGAVPYPVGHGIQPVLLTRSDTKDNLKKWLSNVEVIVTPAIESCVNYRKKLTEVIFDDRGTEMENRNGNRKR